MELGGPSQDATNRSGTMRLAQTLPFQAPSTPEIEPQVSTTRPPKGEGRKGQASSPRQREESSVGRESRPHTQEDRALTRRTPAPTSSAGKKKPAGVKQKAVSVSETASGKNALESQGLEPVSRPSFPASASSSSSLPPLPPGIPYTPPYGAYPPNQKMAPKAGDTLPKLGRPSAGLAKPKPSETGLPSAAPAGPEKTLDNFVLDSFRGGIAEKTAAGGQGMDEKVPPASLLGQLRQDMKQLGEGIKETFRSLLSLR